MKRKSQLWSALTLISLAALVGCGGGGGGETTLTATTPGEAQGVYTGSFSTSEFPTGKFRMLVLENDEIWTVYGKEDSSGGLIVYGLLQGQGAASSGTFNVGSLKDYYYDGTTTTGALTAKYQVGASFNGTVTTNQQSVSFSGVVPAAGSTTYNYNATPNLVDIAGAWSGTNVSGVNSNLTVSSAGTFSGTNQYGCGFSGTIKPRSSGKNVFDITLANNTTAACGSLSGMTGQGIAVTSLLASGKRQLIIPMVSTDKTRGSVYFATR